MTPTALSGKWILVTGGSSGIGRATARALANEGALVIAVGREFPESTPTGVIELVGELATPQGIKAMASDVAGVIGHASLIGIVHAAAVSHLGPAVGLTSDQVDEVFDVNVKAPLLLTSALVPQFGDEGLIVLVGSRASVGAAVCNSAYAASKSSVRSLAATLRAELTSVGIDVCEVVPGSTSTALRERALAGLDNAVSRANQIAPSDAYAAWADRFSAPPSPDTTPEAVADSIVGLFAAPSRSRRVYVPGRERFKEAARGLPTSVAGSVASRLKRR